MQWTTTDVLLVLGIIIAVMLLIILYHLLFIVVDLRKTMKRVETISQLTEATVSKPLAMADQVLDWAIGAMAGLAESKHEKHHQKKE
jgi:hypothetical protein